MKDWKDNVYFVLVEPKEAGNIGASARAIKNMGFNNLCLVNPPSFQTDEAFRFAHGANDILESATIFTTVKNAISDKSIVVGTSRRTGTKRGVFVTPEQGAQRLLEAARINKVAILFGREDRGLFNKEIGECGFLMTVPANKKQPSLNLAHAVMIIAYELSKAGYIKKEPGKISKVHHATEFSFPGLVTHKELAALYEKMEKVLEMLDYVPRGDENLGKKISQNLKHFIGRSGLTDLELKMFHGICSQIKKKITTA